MDINNEKIFKYINYYVANDLVKIILEYINTIKIKGKLVNTFGYYSNICVKIFGYKEYIYINTGKEIYMYNSITQELIGKYKGYNCCVCSNISFILNENKVYIHCSNSYHRYAMWTIDKENTFKPFDVQHFKNQNSSNIKMQIGTIYENKTEVLFLSYGNMICVYDAQTFNLDYVWRQKYIINKRNLIEHMKIYENKIYVVNNMTVYIVDTQSNILINSWPITNINSNEIIDLIIYDNYVYIITCDKSTSTITTFTLDGKYNENWKINYEYHHAIIHNNEMYFISTDGVGKLIQVYH